MCIVWCEPYDHMIIKSTRKKGKSRKAKESSLIEVWYRDYLNQSTNTIGMNLHPMKTDSWTKSLRNMS
jgi:hypothetical protein